MARIERTVFISYRRTDVYTALAVYENLKNQGYDVFFDYRSVSSGDFEQIITSNIKARWHFLLILTPTALDRCNEPGDWLRREIEIAIDKRRNIVPLFFRGFRFGAPSVSEKLTGKLRNLSRYNGLNVHEDYFDEAMHRLRMQYLNLPLKTVLHPVSADVQRVVRAEQSAADKALEQIEDVHELVKGAKGKFNTYSPEAPREEEPALTTEGQVEGEIEKLTPVPPPPSGDTWADGVLRRFLPERATLTPRLLGRIAGGVLLITLLIWGTASLLNNLPTAVTEPTTTSQPIPTRTARLETTITPSSPTETTIPPTPTLGIGSTMEGKDGMTLLYVPASEFMMGSEAGELNEKPVHEVSLDAFWIDRTEVTNAMYALCVDAQQCNPPTEISSASRVEYFGNPEFDNYPVVFVSWEDANDYCAWADRRLPTEAEWEKAARGTDGRTYPWGDVSPETNLLNYNLEVGDTTEVDKYPGGASPYGALDMAGNVWEWVADWDSATYYVSSPPSNPLGPDTGESRVLRGGSWATPEYYVRSALRGANLPEYSNYTAGFRCASSPSSPTETSISPTPTLGIGSTMEGKDGMTLVYVPDGEFTMGNKAEDALAECQKYRSDCQLAWFKHEEPPHAVSLDAFWIDQTEVTNKMYAVCVEAGICKEPTSKESATHSSYYGNAEYDNYPVIYVDWSMAKTYCEWVDRRLPTEAEWEKAARGPDANIFPWGNTFDGTLVNFCDTNCSTDWTNKSFNDRYSDVAPVGSFPSGKSFYGALDMAGNVWEWIADWYGETYYASSLASNPVGPDSGQYRMLRGGAWVNRDYDVRSAGRYAYNPTDTYNSTGFRCAMSATP
jgi:formylglycine-generating enzyme required for sulfatase activity